MGYAELLKDPRWQKRRLEIMERDEWTCQACGDTKATLTVHHKSYRMVDGKFVDIWDYPGEDLITLCEECHAEEEVNLKGVQKHVYFTLRAGFEDYKAISHILLAIKETRIRCGRRLNIEDAKNMVDGFNELSPLLEDTHGMSTTEMLKKLMGEDYDTEA